MHQTTRLLAKASAEEKRLAEISKKIAKICKSVPDRVGGQHMLLQAMVAIAKGKKDICGGKNKF